MRYIILLLIVTSSFLTHAQQKLIITDTLDQKKDFTTQVKEGMSKHHKKYITNDFYKFNVDKKAKFESSDSIVYSVKLITKANGYLLWNCNGKFINVGNKLVIELTNFVILKKSSMSGVDYINVSADSMEPTKGNKINLRAIQESAEEFIKKFK